MAEERVQRRLAAIMAADVVGFSRLMGEDEAGTLAALKQMRAELVDPAIDRYRGRIVKLMGDGTLAEFASVVDAVECAVDIQRGIAGLGGDKKILFRIGINLGDVIIDGDDIYGDGVNVAARLEALAEPGGVCISEVVHQSVEGKLDLSFTDMGAQQVKNIARPVRAFQIGLIGAVSTPPDAPPLTDKPSIAVLPFDNLSSAPEQDFFADGLTEDLINALSYWHTFYVIARHSTVQYKAQRPAMRQIAEDLGVQYILDGSVRTAGNRVRISAQLTDTETSRNVWSERYDRQLEDFFDLQDEITKEIAAKVEPAFARAEQQKAVRKPPTSLAAWEWYQRGIANLDGFFAADANEGKASNVRAKECFQKAIELDPSDSRPVAYLAYAHFRSVLEGYSSEPEADIATTLELARRAITLDDNNPYAHFAYSIGLTYSGQPERGVPEARRAVEINPNYSHAYIPLGNGLNLGGHPAEGVQHLETAIRLNPTDPRNFAYFTFLAEAHLNNRDYQRAIEWSQKAIERNAHYPYAHFVLASALGHVGEIDQATSALRQCLALRPDCVETHPQLPLFKNTADREHILDGLRKAGWEESDSADTLSLPDKPSIAVLPFQNMSGDPEQEYFADGLSEDLITDLSKISGLFVVARNSSFAFKGKNSDVRAVAGRLNVAHVLEGSVRKMGTKVRINAQLVDATTGGHLWAERYDGDLDDIFTLQDEIMAQIVLALELHLTATDRASTARKPTQSVAAYDLCLRGRAEYYNYTPEHFANARRYFEQAIALDPTYADAYGYLSYCLTTTFVFTWPGAEASLDHALELAEKSLALDPQSSVANARLGWVLGFLGKYERATENFEQAIALDPRDAGAFYAFGETMNRAGLAEKAIPLIETAIGLEVVPPPGWEFAIGHSYVLLRNYEDALAKILPVLDRVPKLIPARVQLARAYAEMDRISDAKRTVDVIREVAPRYTIQSAKRMFPYADAENRIRLRDGLRKAGLPE